MIKQHQTVIAMAATCLLAASSLVSASKRIPSGRQDLYNNNNNINNANVYDSSSSSADLSDQDVARFFSRQDLNPMASSQLLTSSRMGSSSSSPPGVHYQGGLVESSGPIQYDAVNGDGIARASHHAHQNHLVSASVPAGGVATVADLTTAAGHHHGHAHGKYYEYREVPKKKTWKFGYKRGNHKHTISRHEHGQAGKHPHFKTKVKWHDSKSKGKGIHLWDYNHHDKKHYGHHG